MRSGTNLPRVGGFNRSVILDTIRRSPEGVSRVEIAGATGLSAQTVSNIVRRLLQEDLVTETGRAASTGGKPRTLLRTNPTAYFSVGIHIDPDTITLVATDLDGSVRGTVHRRTPRTPSANQVVRQVAGAVRGLLERAQIPVDRLLGLGVACPGPLDLSRGLVLSPPNLPGWHEVPLLAYLQEEFGVPVVVDNDATAAAIGERWAGAGGARMGSFAFLYFGTGVGGGLFLGDQVWRGNSGNAGEFGHITVVPNGTPCFCGNKGCLEAYVRPHAIVAETAAALEKRPADPLPLKLEPSREFADYELICQAAGTHPVARQVIQRAAAKVAIAATSLVNVVDVERIVLGGKGVRYVVDAYKAAISEAVNSRSIARGVRTVQVEPSLIGEDAGARGAAALVLDGAYSPQLATLFSRTD
ncbi:ROK family transcriptional regulator [Fodinicola feengrottensis]|uniref:ROK family transcriptional regulator n=1 Tax=Fodinicola feengrottensis TaxID=435914 RepID=A0ABN2GV97_9ACTN|nr:ROK family transcriptional regulator [Fodinicola feengrottensis]